MKFVVFAAAALGACLPLAAQAASQSKTLGNLQADFVLAPNLGGSANQDLAGGSTQIDPRDLLGPSKAIKADPASAVPVK